MEQIKMILSIKEASKQIGLSEYTIRRLFLEGRITGFRSGKKILLNLNKLNEFLNCSTAKI